MPATVSERVIAILTKWCDVDAGTLDEHTELKTIDLDSLTLLEVGLAMQKEFAAPIDDGAIARATTVRDLVTVAEQSMAVS